MTDTRLQGVGVLVTRPAAQAADLVEAIQNKGGEAICLPVIDIIARKVKAIATDAAVLPSPDVAIFVSRNAVAYGLSYAADAALAATGPSTAAAIRAAGQSVMIEPRDGYDSESLLMESALQDVAGKQVRIIRGERGRELLADTLRERGAIVNYLAVYERRLPVISPDLLNEIKTAWRDGKINAITAMSVETLQNLGTLLPEWRTQQLEKVPLVTPAARVIKEALENYPVSRAILASSPQAANMVDAIIDLHKSLTGPAP